MFYLLSPFVLFRDAAVPLLFEATDSGPFGINSYLLFSYVLGFLVSYAFAYGVGFGRLGNRPRNGE